MAKKKSTSHKPETGKQIDIRTVARDAKVSIATVSRVMNGVPTVDARLSKTVWEVIERLGYVPNTQARALVSGRSRLFGVLISDITNPFFPELIQGFEEKAVALGYETMIGSTHRDLRQMELCIQRMLERKVDGVAVMTFGIETPLLDRLANQGIPMVFIDQAPPGNTHSVIAIDYEKGITEAVQHLAGLGHSRIAFLSGPRTLRSAALREQAFRRAIAAAGLSLPRRYLVEGDHTAEAAMLGMRTLLELAHPPTAVLCSNDMTAIGVMHAAFAAGLQIPRDLSVIGFDDIHLARYTLPPMTSIQMSRHDIASAAVLSLKAHIDRRLDRNPDRKPEHRIDAREDARPLTTTLETRLIVRQTTGIPRTTRARKEPRAREITA